MLVDDTGLKIFGNNAADLIPLLLNKEIDGIHTSVDVFLCDTDTLQADFIGEGQSSLTVKFVHYQWQEVGQLTVFAFTLTDGGFGLTSFGNVS